MTEKERVEAVLRREKPDRVPNWPFSNIASFSAVYHRRPIADAYRDLTESLAMQRRVCHDMGWVCSPFYTEFGAADFGGEMKPPASEFSQSPAIVRFPIETEEDVWKLKIPEIKDSAGVSREMTFRKLASQETADNEPFSILLHPVSPIDMVGRICSLETLARWMIKKPDIVHHLLRLTTDIMVEITGYCHDTFGAEGVLAMGAGVICSNQLISPKQFEQFVLPYHQESYQKVLAMGYRHIFCHICGDQNMNLPYWAQVPMGDPGIISIGHEIDFETAARYFPNDIILGNLEPAILQAGTPGEVYEETRKVIEKGKGLAGGFIFALGCSFPPRVSLDNVRAMNQAVDDFGWYE